MLVVCASSTSSTGRVLSSSLSFTTHSHSLHILSLTTPVLHILYCTLNHCSLSSSHGHSLLICELSLLVPCSASSSAASSALFLICSVKEVANCSALSNEYACFTGFRLASSSSLDSFL